MLKMIDVLHDVDAATLPAGAVVLVPNPDDVDQAEFIVIWLVPPVIVGNTHVADVDPTYLTNNINVPSIIFGGNVTVFVAVFIVVPNVEPDTRDTDVPSGFAAVADDK